MNNRLEMIMQSLKEGSLDRTLYEVINELTAEEWVTAINNPEYLLRLKPYLVYTYNNEKIDEICEKGDTQTVARALIEAWFSVYCGGTNNVSEQPSLLSLAGTPALLPLFSGHMINLISKANYSHDVEPFIRDKFKHLSNEMLNYTKSQNYNERYLITGCHEKHPMFPVYHDYDDDTVNNAFLMLYLVSSISKLTSMLDFDNMTPERQAMLDHGNIKGLIETSKVGETKKRRNLKEFEQAESFIAQHYAKYCHYFSEFFFDSKEIAYQRTLYARGLVKAQPSECESPQSEEPSSTDESSLELPSIEIDQDAIRVGCDTSFLDKVFSWLKSALSDDDIKESIKGDESVEPITQQETPVEHTKKNVTHIDSNDSDNDVNELMFSSHKKKGNGAMLFVTFIIGFIALISWLSLVTNGDKSENSIIEQNSKEESPFKVVIVE